MGNLRISLDRKNAWASKKFNTFWSNASAVMKHDMYALYGYEKNLRKELSSKSVRFIFNLAMIVRSTFLNSALLSLCHVSIFARRVLYFAFGFLLRRIYYALSISTNLEKKKNKVNYNLHLTNAFDT